jgi:hypothetical protein
MSRERTFFSGGSDFIRLSLIEFKAFRVHRFRPDRVPMSQVVKVVTVDGGVTVLDPDLLEICGKVRKKVAGE